MRAGLFRIFVYISASAMLVLISGCDESKKDTGSPTRRELEKSQAKLESGVTIGEAAQVFSPEFLNVQGYAIVGGLAGTGSAECPPKIRGYLKQYILRHMPSEDVDKFINSPDTAVVIAEGMLPMAGGRNAVFDVRVTAPGSTQTTSLEHGQLYGADLRPTGRFSMTTRVLAHVEGPVYIDKIDSSGHPTVGYILAGGRTLDDYKIMLSLPEPDYLIANAIRNKLIERFGQGTANALSAGQVEVTLPAQYAGRKQWFISIVKATHLSLSNQARQEKINELISQLTGPGDRNGAEIAIEAIGKESLGPLGGLLNSTDGDARFRAARCMLNMGSDKGLNIMREIAFDTGSSRRTEAIDAIAEAAKRSDAAGMCRRLLRDNDVRIKLLAYEHLRRMDDLAIAEELIGRSFYLENISLAREPLVFVSRSGAPRIAVFGGPIYCKGDLFVQSDDANITLNSVTGQEGVAIIRKIPGKPEIPPISLKCSYELSDIIRTLGSEPVRRKQTDRSGLGVSYSDIIALLNKMVEKGAIDCEFQAGPLPQIGLK